MKRRVLAVAAAAATAIAIVPAAPAFASAAATANLVGATAVHPGERSFTIRVSNAESNLLGLTGKTINAIRVNFPVNEAGIRLGGGAGTAPGFTEATPTDLGSTQFITYRGGSLRPGGSVDITFPANVSAPQARDLLGDFRVQVSSDNFQNASNAPGSLFATVQVLEIIQSGLKAVAPTNADNSKGVTDGTGTAGQAVTFGTEIKNYAQSSLSVLAGVTSSGPGDTGGTRTVSVPGNGGTATTTVPVQLSEAAGVRTITATATATGAEAATKTASFTAEAQALLNPASIDGTRVKSGPGSARDFVINVAKSNPPAVDTLSAKLVFGSNECGVVGAPTYPRGTSSQQLTFRCASVSGADGVLPASVVYSLTDDNLAGYGRTVGVGNIIIDNIAPILDLVVGLPNDRDGDLQTAVKNGDTITVSGNIQNAGDLAGNAVRVVLSPNAGDPVVINAPVSGSGETRTFSGSASPSWNAAATSFGATASIADTADNTGSTEAPTRTTIDLAAPTLVYETSPGQLNYGEIVDDTTIEVTYSDATKVRGGCDPGMWFIDGQLNRVSAVAAGDGKDCKDTDSKTRRLTLRSPLQVDQTPTVTFDPVGARTPLANRRPVKDSAGNDAVRQTIDTISRLVPAAPQIVKLERKDSASSTGAFEDAYLDTEEGRYYTNVAGADALRLTVAGVKQNYTVQVLRNGAVVAERKFTAAPSLGASSYNGDILVPMTTTDGPAPFSVRFVSATSNTGDGTPFTVVLDRAAPTLGAATISGSTVRAAFSEKIVLGSDFADNWFVSEMVQGESGQVRRTVNVDTVTPDGLTARSLQVTLLDTSKFAGIDYFVQSGTRYEDRAGNTLGNTLHPAG
jgi:hypothetical protein